MFKKILEKIKEYDTIIIHRHMRPDGDCIGSQMGLKYLLKASFPNKNIYAVGDDIPTYLRFLGENDVISDDTYKGALVISVDTSVDNRIYDTCTVQISKSPFPGLNPAIPVTAPAANPAPARKPVPAAAEPAPRPFLRDFSASVRPATPVAAPDRSSNPPAANVPVTDAFRSAIPFPSESPPAWIRAISSAFRDAAAQVCAAVRAEICMSFSESVPTEFSPARAMILSVKCRCRFPFLPTAASLTFPPSSEKQKCAFRRELKAAASCGSKAKAVPTSDAATAEISTSVSWLKFRSN